MVKVRQIHYYRDDGTIDAKAWLEEIQPRYSSEHFEVIKQALILAQHTGGNLPSISPNHPCLQQGLHMAEILAELNLGASTIAAALLYNNLIYGDLRLDDISEQLGPSISMLISGAEKMSVISTLTNYKESDAEQKKAQINKLRKMLLAMVEDIRIVLLKLAERTCTLRAAKSFSPKLRQNIAMEAQEIYAPLANRLGIGQIKWELEDLSFRYLETDTYMHIAKALDAKRIEREKYIEEVKSCIDSMLQQNGITNYEITGRAKHIYSIHRKMKRKNVSLEQIYDASAVRILVSSIEDCYASLSLVHVKWKHIEEEFDDYIANPKANGYRSLHSAIIGPQNKNIEI